MGSSRQWKLGAFVILVVAATATFLFWLASSRVNRRPTATVVTWFDESVQGLSQGSEVKFRGMKVGDVVAIRIASDRNHLEVKCSVFEDFLDSMQVHRVPVERRSGQAQLINDMRSQLSASGLTGLKVIEFDVATPEEVKSAVGPPSGVELARDVEFCLLSKPSTLLSVERAVTNALDAVTVYGGDVGGVVHGLNDFLKTINQAEIPTVAARLLADLSREINELDTRGLTTSAQELFHELREAVEKTSAVVAALDKEDGDVRRALIQWRETLMTAQKAIEAAQLPETTLAIRDGAAHVSSAADSVALAADKIAAVGDDLTFAVRSIRSTSEDLRRLINLLEHEPSALIRGRTYAEPPEGR